MRKGEKREGERGRVGRKKRGRVGGRERGLDRGRKGGVGQRKEGWCWLNLSCYLQVLQNLANHVTFKKEVHMEVFNQFLTRNFERSRQLALAMASMGPYQEGEAVEHIAFLKEAHKYRLHTLLWNNQERMAAYTASIR